MRVEQFAEFFRALTVSAEQPGGQDPYPWQSRLVAQVFQHPEGRWPEELDLPTGSGKTATLDVSVFLLALEADRAPGERRFPLRTVMVVDRRTIVDQGYIRACRIAKALREAQPNGGILWEVASRLRRIGGLAGDEEPLAVALLRGAMIRDESWARRPDQPLLALSTVDQVGSRLLFRGYGLSDGMRPIHAGLLGNDTLLLLDEVHLAAPFEETLTALDRRYSRLAERHLPRRWSVVRLSATPRPPSAAVEGVSDPALSEARSFRLNAEDQADLRLRQRLDAAKPTRLATVAVRGEEPHRLNLMAERAAAEARALAAPGRTVGVLLNRVDSARRCALLLQDAGEVQLLTGRMRPLDRAHAEQRVADWVDPGRPPGSEGSLRFIVATQCIEAGADYDLDAMVTECASWDALRQRVGRLNRSGQRTGARAVVLAREDHLKSPDETPIYGPSLAATYRWLEGLGGGLDLGVSAMPAPSAAALSGLLGTPARSPVLLPLHLDLWAQTAPVPRPDPDISLFLHGPKEAAPEVMVVWRADLSEEELLGGPVGVQGEPETAVNRLTAVPPGTLEALSLPIYAVRAWLNRGTPPPLGDLEGEGSPDLPKAPKEVLRALRWRGDQSEVIEAAGLRPGDTLVVPATRGGLSQGTWDPESEAVVSDLGDLVQLRQRGRPTLRVHPALMDQLPPGLSGQRLPCPRAEADPDRADEEQELSDWLTRLSEAVGLSEHLSSVVEALNTPSGRRPKYEALRMGGTWTLIARKRREEGIGGVSLDAETSSHTGVAIGLKSHLLGVQGLARGFAQRAGLDADRVADLAAAGAWHDLGKADPRFQVLLHGGSRVRAAASKELLAKSARTAEDRAARLRAQEKSGYPKGGRHELLSLAMLEGAKDLKQEAEARGGDWELICYLVSSHHGQCRPFAPVVADPAPLEVELRLDGQTFSARSDHPHARLDSGVSDRFWLLIRRYGWHGLAWMEAILRLADHRRSEIEQMEPSSGEAAP